MRATSNTHRLTFPVTAALLLSVLIGSQALAGKRPSTIVTPPPEAAVTLSRDRTAAVRFGQTSTLRAHQADAGSTERIPALMYHRILCAPDWTRGPHRWVCPEVFDATLRLLKDNGWDTMTARQVSLRLKLGLSFPPKTFVIVIDD